MLWPKAFLYARSIHPRQKRRFCIPKLCVYPHVCQWNEKTSVIAYFCGKIGFVISASTCDLIAWFLRGEGAYLMEPITAIVTALALGAAAGLKGTTEQLITDGYTALKMLIKRTFPRTSVSVDQLEQAPDSKARRAVVEEDLTQEGAGHNAEILAHTKALLDVIAQRVPHTAEIIGVSLKDITGASLRIADVLSSGSGVSVAGANIGGDITIQGVRAGPQGGRPPNG
jgi:hypothetical protein